AIGITHIPRPEDWPIMPIEHIHLLFRPTNFFTVKPGLDVPRANDKCSIVVFSSEGNGQNGHACHCRSCSGVLITWST
ncbi:hypothetical protein BKA93DRAFT_745362, partial [Sparassis latifolia]